MSNTKVPKSGTVMMRLGPCMDRIRKRKADAERALGIALTWVQFFDMLLNRLEELEGGKKGPR